MAKSKILEVLKANPEVFAAVKAAYREQGSRRKAPLYLSEYLKSGQKYIERKELSREMGCSVGAVDKWRKAGLPFRKCGDMVLFEVAKIEAWMQETSGTPPSKEKPAAVVKAPRKARAVPEQNDLFEGGTPTSNE